MKMHLLSGGRLRLRRSVYYPGAPREETIELPISCALLMHPQGNVLFDTGCHPSVSVDAEGRWGAMARVMTPVFAAEDTVVHQLKLACLGPDDIDVVVCSHLHPDHCGCNVFFRKATVVAQASEVAAARAENGPAQGYLPIEWDHPNLLDGVDGQRDLFGDGRITLLPMPGHTPGMMVAHVALDRDGPFVLASDAAAVRAHIDQRYVPRNTWNAELALVAIEELARMEQGGATILLGHDDAQWRSLRTGVDYYE
jgi:glyoxylase-like metal-dependent hydrolase (beta-lactamase superfamily II)